MKIEIINHLKDLARFRELLMAFTVREIKVRYKETILGAAWAIVQPLSLALVFTLIFSKFLKIETEGIPYPIFSYSALLPWTFFTTSLTFGSIAILNNSNLITKVYFPREIIPFSSVGAALLDLFIASTIFFAMMIYYKVTFTINILYVFPLLIILLIFTSAVVLFSSALVIIWRDVKFVIPLLIQLWIFATPVIYPVSKVPDAIRVIYTLDPITPVINGFRAVTILGKAPDFKELAISFLISLILFWTTYTFFKKKERIFADII